jgi:hypothetical protein
MDKLGTPLKNKDLLETLQVFGVGLALTLWLPRAWMMVLVALVGALFFSWGRGLERQRSDRKRVAEEKT